MKCLHDYITCNSLSFYIKYLSYIIIIQKVNSMRVFSIRRLNKPSDIHIGVYKIL